VCGTAAAEMRTVVVPDVEKFPGHVTCDSRSKSEIVVPVRNNKGNLLAVFDIDSERLNTFDKDDQRGLEKLMSWFEATA
jgi:GAF domain-containing protein